MQVSFLSDSFSYPIMKPMKSIARLDDLDPADFIIKWRMTEMCDINCSYCLRTSTIKLSAEEKKPKSELLKEQERRLCEVAGTISEILDGTDFKTVKIDTVGGEVSLLNLKEIFSHLKTDKMKRIQMTTNLMRDASYYSALADFLHSRGTEFSLTASFHYEFQPFDRYFGKISELKGKADILKCEIVSNEKNQELCKEFIRKCGEISVGYNIDADMRRTSSDSREKGLIYGSKKSDDNPRYKVTFTDGSIRTYRSRSELMCDRGIAEISDMRLMATHGYFCTNTSRYLYIDFDTAVGRTDESDSCTVRTPIELFKLQKPKRCPHGKCSLCGHIDLWR